MSDEIKNVTTTDDLPDWARKLISDANSEAAKYRTEKNQAVEAAKAEVEKQYSSQLEKVQAELAEKAESEASARFEVDRLKVALAAGIESDKVTSFARLLQGDSEEALRSHADELKKLFTVKGDAPVAQKATDSSQGTGNSVPPLNGDPILDSLKAVLYK